MEHKADKARHAEIQNICRRLAERAPMRGRLTREEALSSSQAAGRLENLAVRHKEK